MRRSRRLRAALPLLLAVVVAPELAVVVVAVAELAVVVSVLATVVAVLATVVVSEAVVAGAVVDDCPSLRFTRQMARMAQHKITVWILILIQMVCLECLTMGHTPLFIPILPKYHFIYLPDFPILTFICSK